MVKISFTRLHGCQQFRQRLLLSTLSNNPIVIDDIRSDDSSPGLRPYEISLLRLLEKLSDDCVVEINETGTKLKYKPGVILGGKNLTHDCGLSRSIGYFLEPLVVLGLFGKRNLSITLKGNKVLRLVLGRNPTNENSRMVFVAMVQWNLPPYVQVVVNVGITNDNVDPCVDTFRMTTLHMLKHFGMPSEGLELKIISRGAPPLGGGEVHLQVPIVHSSLSAINWVDEGMVKRIRGVTYSTKVSPQMENRMVNSARGIFNQLLPDVYIFTDHKSGPQAGRSPGYGILIVAETTTGCLISAEASACSGGNGLDTIVGEESKHGPTPPEDLGVQAASLLLEEIKQGGVVDSTHQGLLFLLCALCPQDVSKIRVGKLSPYAVQTLRNIRDFLGVKFVIKPGPTTNTVVLKCVGCGLKNLSRKIS